MCSELDHNMFLAVIQKHLFLSSYLLMNRALKTFIRFMWTSSFLWDHLQSWKQNQSKSPAQSHTNDSPDRQPFAHRNTNTGSWERKIKSKAGGTHISQSSFYFIFFSFLGSSSKIKSNKSVMQFPAGVHSLNTIWIGWPYRTQHLLCQTNWQRSSLLTGSVIPNAIKTYHRTFAPAS